MNAPAPEPPVSISCSRHFLDWLGQERIALALSTYQTNRLILLGRKPDGTLSGFERLFEHAMGLHATRERLWLATRFQLWELHNALAPGATDGDGFDALYVPRRGYVTGELDVHDLALDADGTPLFVNSLYSCLARPSTTHSFEPVWRPKFISQLLPEDRCHLNGMAMRDGRAAYVTAVSRSDVAAGWRERRGDGGVLIDVASGEIALTGLSMPHSPRWRDGKLWLLNSGSGELGSADLARGAFEPAAFVPGYGRGLAFHKQWAIVGVSKPRGNKLFTGLALDQRLKDKDAVARCGLRVIDLATGGTAHWVDIEGVVTELYDVQLLPDTVRPKALGFKTDEVRHLITFADGGRAITHRLVPQPDGVAPSAAAVASRAPAGYEFKVQLAVPLGALRDRLPELLFPKSPAAELPADLQVSTMVALSGAQPVALAVVGGGEDRIARLLSLVVAPEHRRNGLATQLLRLAEERAARLGLTSLGAMFSSHWPMNAAFEALLAKNGWLAPAVQMIRCLTTMEKIATGPWVNEPLPALSAGVEMFPWTELSAAQRARIEAALGREGGAPRALNPLQMPERLEPLCSFGLRRGDDVVGWVVCHRLKPRTIQVTALYVDASLRRSGDAWVLARHATRRQFAAAVPNMVWEIHPDNRSMRKAMEIELGPWITGYSEVRSSGKVLAPVGELQPA